MKKALGIFISMLFLGINSFGQERLLTVAEKSDFKSTSDYKDVVAFIRRS